MTDELASKGARGHDRAFMVRPKESRPTKGEGLPIMRFLALAADTGCHFSLQENALNFSIPMHWHETDDECCYVLDGEATLTVGDEPFELKPGSFAYAPRGVPHSVTLKSERFVTLAISVPGIDFERYSMAIGRALLDGVERGTPEWNAIASAHGWNFKPDDE